MSEKEETLAETLGNLGLFMALGTLERGGQMPEQGVPVKPRAPNTWDRNNGVLVVYDDEGRPWIGRSTNFPRHLIEEGVCQGLKRGAYVPHSNDGGNFILNELPALVAAAQSQ